LLYRIMIIDSSGVLIDNYNISKLDIRVKDETLFGSLIGALIQFSEEIFARPQRLDLDGYAMSFYKIGTKDESFYVVALTDSDDNSNATKKLVMDIVKVIKNYVASSISDEVIFIRDDLRNEIKKQVMNIAKKYNRILASYRSGGLKSILTGTVTGIIAYVIVSTLAFSLIPRILRFGFETETNSFAALVGIVVPVFLVGSLVGIASGIAAGKPHEGAISGWLSYSVNTIILYFTIWIGSWGFISALTVLAFNLIGIATLSSTFGYILGLWEDERKLSVPKNEHKLQ